MSAEARMEEGEAALAGITPPRSILLVMLSALGDAVLALPVVNALRRSFPEASITWVLQPTPHALVRGHPGVDELVLFRRGTRGTNPRALLEGAEALWDAVRELRRIAHYLPGGTFDLLLDLQVYLKAGLLTALAPARIKLGFDRARARDLNWLFTTHRIPPHPSGLAHVQDQYLEFLRPLGVDPEPVEYGLAPTPGEKEAQAAFFGGLSGPACAVVLATSDPRKDWNAGGYAAVLSSLHRDFGLHPLLVGGRSIPEERMAEQVRELLPSGFPLTDARADDVRRLLWLLEGSALAVTPDTGPLHLARALEVPVVGLFGFTNPKRTGPWRLFSDLVVDGYARDPGEGYPVSRERREEGMGRITPGMVMEKVERAVSRYPRGRGTDPA